ncbi:uncharacterized [Tachysurus ichikawai]
MLCNAHGCTPARCRHVLSADTGLFTLISLQLPQWQSQPIIALYTYHTTTHKHITEPEWTHVTENRKQCDQEQKQGSNREKVREKQRKSTAIARQFSVIRCYSREFGETFLWD